MPFVTSSPAPTSLPVTTNPYGVFPYTGASNLTGTPLGINQGRNLFFTQNISPNWPLYVNLSNSVPSTQAFSFILNPASVTGQGGASFLSESYKGPVSISGAAAVVWEI